MNEAIVLEKSPEVMESRPGQYLTFNLDSQVYGIPINVVREINRVGQITRVPKASGFVAGVIDLRGRVIPVVSLRARLGMPPTEQTHHTCIVVIDTDAGQIGMVVDSVNSVVEIKEGQIEPKPTVGSEADTDFITGMANVDGKIMVLLAVVRCFSRDCFV